MFIKAIRLTLFTFTLMFLTGYAYPMLITVMAKNMFPHQANGSLVKMGDKVIGSELIAQNFTGKKYFHPRPSAAGAGYEANNSGATNLSVTSKTLNDGYKEKAAALKGQGTEKIPADMITTSGSGLDPHITPEAAAFQAQRVAKARNMDASVIQTLILEHTENRTFGFIGMPRVNVLALNLALDKMSKE